MADVTTNFNGSVASTIYKDVAEGNEVIQKGIARLETREPKQIELGSLRQTDNPLGDYVASPSTVNSTGSFAYANRTLTLVKKMVYQEFNPQEYLSFWEKWRSRGTVTELRMNPEFMSDVLTLLGSKIGAQLSYNFFEGDTTLETTTGKNLFDGFIKKAIADVDVIDAVTNGVITDATILVALQNVIDAIPDKDYDNDDYKILVSTKTWRIIQRLNTNAKASSDGLLGDSVKDMIEQKRIIPFVKMKDDYMVATKVGLTEESNLVFGFYFDEKEEFASLNVNKVSNASDLWFLKMNIKLGMDFVYPENVILYQPT